MTKVVRVSCVVVFCCGLLFFVNSRVGLRHVAKPHVITYVVSKGKIGEAMEPYELRVRVVKATGEYKETRYGFDGGKLIRAATADAIYSMSPGDKSRQFESKYTLGMHKDFSSKSFLTSHPQFVGEEIISGLRTYTIRSGDTGSLLQQNYAPECGATPLRTILEENGYGFTVEALKVDFREVSDDEVSVADFPIRFTKAEQKAEALRQQGFTTRADTLSQIIGQLKDK